MDRGISVRFWGTRGSIPTPGIGTTRYGGNTSCVSVELTDGLTGPTGPSGPSGPTGPTGPTVGGPAEVFILDAGSGIRLLGLDVLRGKRLPLTAHLLLTHTHWDHIQGFPFVAPAFVPGNAITV